MTNTTQYSEDNIRHLSDMEHIRTRPGMYIGRLSDGSQAEDGIYVLLKEVIDNSIDEFKMGAGKRIEVDIEENLRVTVRDYGRGIPLGKLVEAVSMLNTGGKYDSKAFQKSVGLNGVGLKAVNALSTRFEVQSFRDGQTRRATFSKGILEGDTTEPTQDENGTAVFFEPDASLFKHYAFRSEFVEVMLRNYTYLNTGLTIMFNGRRIISRDGLSDLLSDRMDYEPLYPIIHLRGEDIEVAFTHTKQNGEEYYSFVNGQNTTLGGTHQAAFKKYIAEVIKDYSGKNYEYADIRGQGFFVRALQLAAAGGHNVLAFGPPGCGKTLAMQKFPALLPLLGQEEAQPVTRIYSIAGLLPPDSPLVRSAPFRQPHQTASIEGICGGGPRLTPGEISLAHNGVLFLDEAAEFKASVLQMLRVPLESGAITLSRAGRSTVFPASFQLLLATNPCPCGNFGSRDKLCLCSSSAVAQYWKKFSAPLLDRVDICVQVEKSEDSQAGNGREESGTLTTAELREGIARAVLTQRARQGKKNARLTPSEISCFCPLSADAEALLDEACDRYSLSPRGKASCIKLARTAADMRGEDTISAGSMAESLAYRKAGGLAEELGMM